MTLKSKDDVEFTYSRTWDEIENMLEKAGFAQADLAKSYVNNIIHKYAFRRLKENSAMGAFRLLSMGFATYPSLMFKKSYTYILFLLAISGPIGYLLLKAVKRNYSNN